MNKPHVSVLQAAARFVVSARSVRLLLVAGSLAALPSGCSQWTGWDDSNKVQVQFYAPPGASVTVRKFMGSNYASIDPERSNRLEEAPDTSATFNLSTKKSYDFKYTSADGLPGVSVYGQIDVHKVKSAEARRFVAHTFVPVFLPSEYYDTSGVNLYPVRGPSGVGLTQLELEHLREGDLVRKVYFIADLQQAWETSRMIDDHIERLRSAETVLNTELELVDARFEAYRQDALYADPTDDPLAASEDRSGKSAQFVKLEALRQCLENVRFDIRHQVDDLTNEKRIRTRLLDSMKIVNRRGSLVLATPENQWEFHDAEEQVASCRVYPGFAVGPDESYSTGCIALPPLGEVVMVLTVGGRHEQWGPPPAAEDGVAMNGSR